MKNVIITGPTGMIGNIALHLCLEREDVGKVTTITRRPTGISHEKLNEVIHSDFLNDGPIADHLKDQDVALYCIGVYTGAVPDDEFIRITVDYTKAFADALIAQNNNHTSRLTFCFLSGAGADQTEKSRMIFARTKGAAEKYLQEQNFGSLHIFRPGYIFPVTPRREPNTTYRIMRSLYPIISKVYPNIGISSEDLARVMVEKGLEGGGSEDGGNVIHENRDIRNLRR
jgi:nucleoside-diphosphate-sugar epimerase